MFNGIIKNTGKVHKILFKNEYCALEIKSNLKVKKDEIGSSISCSGACLTVDKFKNNIVKFYISRETLNKTVFKRSKKGDVINLEKSLKYGDRISGHLVQGHVDTTATVSKVKFIGKSWLVSFKILKNFKKYIALKGSITINGVSLTISKILPSGFQISIIPQTLNKTNLIFLKKSNLVNVEFDILGKYIKNFIK
jgi:riboflavin synthase